MNKVLLPKTAWFLFLLIPLTFFGFYPSYFSQLFSPFPSIFHIHTLFLVIWIAMVIAQPVLIHQKKTEWHRQIGKASYLVMPIVVITIYLMVRHSYYVELERLSSDLIREKYNLTSDEIYLYAAAREIKALIALIWLVTFYLLAIFYRKNVLFHATYMLSSILVLVGPSLDRIIFNVIGRFRLPFAGPAEYFTFTLTLILLFLLLIYQRKKGYSLKPVTISLFIYLIGILGYTFLQGTKVWQYFVEMMM